MRLRLRYLAGLGALGFLLLLAAAAWIWRDDIARTLLDPRVPYQTYKAPPAPDYSRRGAWAVLPDEADPVPAAAEVFFIHPTTYDGGEEWNARVGDRDADRVLTRTMLPNYAGPYVRVGRVFAPRYRQASLYSLLTLRDDARDARRFAYADIRAAFRQYMSEHNDGRPLFVVGVEQGGSLAARLIAEEITPNPEIRCAGAHLIDTVVAVGSMPVCEARSQAGCVVAWRQVWEGEDAQARRLLERGLVWEGERLENLGQRSAVCVNPVLGRRTIETAPARSHLGAANASRLEWGVRPALLKRQLSARCVDGILRVSRPESPSLRPRGSWKERRRALPFNLFYADLEADALARVAALLSPPPALSPAASRTAPPAL